MKIAARQIAVKPARGARRVKTVKSAKDVSPARRARSLVKVVSHANKPVSAIIATVIAVMTVHKKGRRT